MISLRASILALLAASACIVQATPDADKTEKPLNPEEAQKIIQQRIEAFGWTRTGKGKLGTGAEIAIPPGYRFTGKSGCQKMLELTHNIPGDSELGVIAPEDLSWWVLFEYDDVGYVRDTDKDKLDPDAILKQLQEAQERSNEERLKKGMSKLTLVGWAMPPRYNTETHNLEWAVKVQGEKGHISINYLTKLLGRRGVMHVTLLVDPEEMNEALPDYQKLLTGFGYTIGQSYAEYRPGDKVAEYALTGLITAGAGVALVKSGLLAKIGIILAKLGKATYLLVVGAAAAVRKMFNRLTGRGDSNQR